MAEKRLTAQEVAEREGVTVKRIHALVRQQRVSGVKWHGNALSISARYTISAPPVRKGRKRTAEE